MLHAWSTVPDALMQRAFQFKTQIIIDPGGSDRVCGCLDRVRAPGIRRVGMVIGWYASTTTGVVLSWWMAKWRPFRGRFSFRIWREMAGFSLPLFLDGHRSSSRVRCSSKCSSAVSSEPQIWASTGTPTASPRCRARDHSRSVPTCCSPPFRGFPTTAPVPGSLPARARLDLVRCPSGRSIVGCVGPAGSGIAARRGMARRRGRHCGDGGLGLGTALTSVGREAMKGAGRSSAD